MVRMLAVLALLIPCVLSGGCSVGMALVGNKNPDLSVVQVGATRDEVESHIGAAAHAEKGDDGRTLVTYSYLTGNEPSPRRAVIHVIANIVTMGIWEMYGTMMELEEGQRHKILVTYGPDNRVESFSPIEEVCCPCCDPPEGPPNDGVADPSPVVPPACHSPSHVRDRFKAAPAATWVS